MHVHEYTAQNDEGRAPREARHRGLRFDVATLNAPAVAAFTSDAAPFPLLIVPGFTPRFGWTSGLHPKCIARLTLALSDFRLGVAPTILVCGGDVHSADNEALLMRQWLLAAGLPESRVLIEPWSRHTTSNLRNAGAIMLELGAREALVITSEMRPRHPTRAGWRYLEQGYHLSSPWLSGFHMRCLAEFRHLVGELTWLGPHRIRFRPDPKCATQR